MAQFLVVVGQLAILAGGLMAAAGLAWVGMRGLRGVPDSSGQRTSKPVAVVCLGLAVLVAGGAVAVVVWIQR